MNENALKISIEKCNLMNENVLSIFFLMIFFFSLLIFQFKSKKSRSWDNYQHDLWITKYNLKITENEGTHFVAQANLVN